MLGASVLVSGRLGATLRRDRWWLGPLWMATCLTLFLAYAIWAGLQGKNYETGPYLSPFYAPLIVPSWPGWWPAWLRTPAIVIVWIPFLFRTTCYYFRKAYYRGQFLNPPACAVGPGARRPRYRGETSLLVWQNLHRYAFYPALVLVGFHFYDAIHAFLFEQGFGIGLGTAIIWLDALSLAAYTLGCHALRHLIGGGVDCWSCSLASRVRYRGWRAVSVLNAGHAFWGWFSLLTVIAADLYVRLVAGGAFNDPYVILMAG